MKKSSPANKFSRDIRKPTSSERLLSTISYERKDPNVEEPKNEMEKVPEICENLRENVGWHESTYG